MSRRNKIALLMSAVITIATLSACDVSDVYMTKKVYETQAPNVPGSFKNPAILVFTKTNGFRHDSIEAGVLRLKKMAQENNWDIYHTENGAVFNEIDLAKFSSTVWLSTSGDVLNKKQKQVFASWLKNGAGFVGIHGTGGDPAFDGQWTWFAETVIGAIFIGHPMFPQFQDGRIIIEDKSHPATAKLPDSWVTHEEWYSFDRNPRDSGFTILATVDEDTYSPRMLWSDLSMGEDHPIVWHGCLEQGRTFYTALGHEEAAYDDPHFINMMTGAISWASKLEGNGCDKVEMDAAQLNVPQEQAARNKSAKNEK